MLNNNKVYKKTKQKQTAIIEVPPLEKTTRLDKNP
jgi:hypothetical protein